MKLIALCKTFQGEEFLPAMVDSISDHVDKIVFVNSETGWNGRIGNTCKPIINEISKNNDKIISLDHDTINQDEQCVMGYEYIRKNLNADMIMIIDTDEVWDRDELTKAIEFLEAYPGHEAYRTGLWTYIKTEWLRVNPPEPLMPVCFIKPDLTDFGKDARYCGLPWKGITDDEGELIRYHHYIYVRKYFNTILEKIVTSHVSEGCYYQDMSRWIEEVWNQLPNIKGDWKRIGFHPHLEYQDSWKGIRVVSESEIPISVKNHYLPDPDIDKYKKLFHIICANIKKDEIDPRKFLEHFKHKLKEINNG